MSLYRIYYLSDSSRARMLEPELDGIVELTAEQFTELDDLGDKIVENDYGEFELELALPLQFKQVMETLPREES